MSKIRTLKQMCWEEYRVARQLSTGQSDQYIATWRIPGWFVTVELGFGDAHGPSILWNLVNLERTNRRNKAQIEARKAPDVHATLRKRRLTASEIGKTLRRHVERVTGKRVAA